MTMGNNPLEDLLAVEQSTWLDDIDRAMIQSGELRRLISRGLSGMTSNPTIFEKTISSSTAYDDQMRELFSAGKSDKAVLDALMVRDIQMAADDFRPVYDRTGGRDGFVSIEIAPTLAYDTEATVRAAREMHASVGRENVMIKVPSTPEGIPAFETLTAGGISVNVTLIFSIETYEDVANAYLAGLERLVAGGTPGSVRSVASVFVSRVDTLVDKKLKERIESGASSAEKSIAKSLLGKVAVANTKYIYRKYREIFGGERFGKLRERGANVQRPLWGSTGTKNPDYSDVLYVEELIGGDVVNTVPSKTLAAFEDHGKIRKSVEEDLQTAGSILSRLAELGIDIRQVTGELQTAGVKAFADSYQQLLDRIAGKRKELAK